MRYLAKEEGLRKCDAMRHRNSVGKVELAARKTGLARTCDKEALYPCNGALSIYGPVVRSAKVRAVMPTIKNERCGLPTATVSFLPNPKTHIPMRGSTMAKSTVLGYGCECRLHE